MVNSLKEFYIFALDNIYFLIKLSKRSELIRKSTRKEFELARYEKDPVLIMKMIITSREAILKTKEKVFIVQ